MNIKNRSARYLVVGLFVLSATLIVSGGRAMAQEEATTAGASQSSCECWIAFRTGKKVPTVPASGINYGSTVENLNSGGVWRDPGVAIISIDGKSARNTRTGKQYAQEADGCWVDIKTGKRVPTMPASGINYGSTVGNLNSGGVWRDPGVAIVSIDGKSARNTSRLLKN